MRSLFHCDVSEWTRQGSGAPCIAALAGVIPSASLPGTIIASYGGPRVINVGVTGPGGKRLFWRRAWRDKVREDDHAHACARLAWQGREPARMISGEGHEAPAQARACIAHRQDTDRVC